MLEYYTDRACSFLTLNQLCLILTQIVPVPYLLWFDFAWILHRSCLFHSYSDRLCLILTQIVPVTFLLWIGFAWILHRSCLLPFYSDSTLLKSYTDCACSLFTLNRLCLILTQIVPVPFLLLIGFAWILHRSCLFPSYSWSALLKSYTDRACSLLTLNRLCLNLTQIVPLPILFWIGFTWILHRSRLWLTPTRSTLSLPARTDAYACCLAPMSCCRCVSMKICMYVCVCVCVHVCVRVCAHVRVCVKWICYWTGHM